jgi:hypothetical protein
MFLPFELEILKISRNLLPLFELSAISSRPSYYLQSNKNLLSCVLLIKTYDRLIPSRVITLSQRGKNYQNREAKIIKILDQMLPSDSHKKQIFTLYS